MNAIATKLLCTASSNLAGTLHVTVLGINPIDYEGQGHNGQILKELVRRQSSLTFHIFNFFSETAERDRTNLNRKQDLNVLYQVCVFPADRKN